MRLLTGQEMAKKKGKDAGSTVRRDRVGEISHKRMIAVAESLEQKANQIRIWAQVYKDRIGESLTLDGANLWEGAPEVIDAWLLRVKVLMMKHGVDLNPT